jgi:hypothetical protein
MPSERLAMRHVRDVIRLKEAGMPVREIARRIVRQGFGFVGLTLGAMGLLRNLYVLTLIKLPSTTRAY